MTVLVQDMANLADREF